MSIQNCLGCSAKFTVGGRSGRRKGSKYCSRHCAMAQEYKKYKDTLRNKEWLTQKYIVEKLNMAEIGRLVGCPTTSVKRIIEEFGIEVRNLSESRTSLFDKRGRKAVTQEELIIAYGGKCQCCDESEKEFLTLDHIGGGGNEHRKSLGGNGVVKVRQELKRLGWPKDKFRLLCMNCNHATRHGRTCPHELKRVENRVIDVYGSMYIELVRDVLKTLNGLKARKELPQTFDFHWYCTFICQVTNLGQKTTFLSTN